MTAKVTKKYPLILLGLRLRRIYLGVCGPPGARTQNLQIKSLQLYLLS
jgi:hypothetical protein